MYNVLIADDEPFILEGLKHVINWDEHGLEIVATAANGIEALEVIKNNNVNLLLTDIKMPNMDGLSLLKEIRKKGHDIRCIILSGYDDFEYVREAAKLGIENYLLKPVEPNELSSTILNTIEKVESDLYKKMKSREDINILRDNILYRWVSGNISSVELLDRSSILGMDLEYNKYVVCLVRILNNRDVLDSLSRSSLLNICNESIKDVGNSISFFDLNGDIVILFSGQAEHVRDTKILSVLKTCIANISSRFDNEVFVTVGSFENDFMSISNSFQNAKNLMDYSLLLSPNSIVDYSEILKSTSSRKKVLNFDFNDMKELLTSRKFHEANLYIDQIYSIIRNTDGITPSYLKSISIELLYNIINISASLKVNIYEIKDYNENMFTKVMQIKNINELSGWVKEILNQVIKLVVLKDTDSNPLIKRITSFIDKDFAQDISLKKLSTAFNINAAYLGQLFKNETGEMFSNYLNKVRIEKAKEMLISTNLNLNDISARVGYANVTYFYSIFRKYTGENPTKYKRELQT